MFIELIDLLRCPVDHEDSWLVAAFTRMDGRFVIEGKLGCPVCSASYAVTRGIAVFADSEISPVSSSSSPDEAMRVAALLGLTRPGALILLDEEAAGAAADVAALAECRVIAMNAPALMEESERVGLIHCDARIPIAPGSVDGIVFSGDEGGFSDAARVLRPGGRIIAPARSRLHPAFREMARDERSVVAELVGPLVTLSGKGTGR